MTMYDPTETIECLEHNSDECQDSGWANCDISETLPVRGHLVVWSQSANVNSRDRLKLWLKAQLDELWNQPSQRLKHMTPCELAVLRARIEALRSVFYFIEQDRARREVSKW